MKDDMQQSFVRKVQAGYVIKIGKIVGVLVLLAGFIQILASSSGLALTVLESLGLASLALHLQTALKAAMDIAGAKKMVEGLGLMFVSSPDEAVKEIKKAEAAVKKEEDETRH